MSEVRDLLQQAVVELEAVSAQLQEGIADGERAKHLAERALELSSQIGEFLPQVIREIEDAAQGRTSGS